MRKQLTILLLLLSPIFLLAQVDEVTFSHKGGVYASAFPLELSCHNSSHHIRYTLNGSTPDANARLYTDALFLNRTMVSSSDIYKILISPSEESYYPDSVMKAIVIRAAAFDASGQRVSEVVTQSYFIQSLGCVIHNLPIVSICADSLSLFSYDTGILVPGVFFNPDSAELTGNYMQHGREWERRVNVEFYTTDNDGFNQQAGLRTHGGAKARCAQQKGLKLYARNDYGKKNFKFKIFDELPFEKYKHLVLKPFRNAISPAGVQDWLANHIASQMNMGTLTSRPVVLFLNGEYWGIYYLEEKGDERYLESHYNVDPDNVNIIDSWATAENGSSDSYYALYYWLMGADLSDSAQYQYFSEQIDIPNFIDYMIFELFSANIDWPINNVRCWQVGNDPWRWFFFDGDCCFYDQSFDVYANITYSGEEIVYPTAGWSTLFFRKLLQNDEFVNQFLSRLYTVSQNQLNYRNTKPYLTTITDMIRDEIKNQIDRFNNPTSMREWKNYCKEIDWFLRDRKNELALQTNRFFNLPSEISDLICFPNPLNEERLSLQFISNQDTPGTIAIYDMSGKCVFLQWCGLQKGEMHIIIKPNLPAGVYILKICGYSQKIIVI